MNLKQLLYDNGEIEFDYNGNHYFMACYYTKPLFRKGKTDFWLIGHLENKDELQKFDTLDELLNTIINGKKLREVWDEVNITYP